MADDSQALGVGAAAIQGGASGAGLGPWGIAAGAGLGAATSIFGGMMGASAASKAAAAQQAAAEAWKQEVTRNKTEALGHVLTPQALAAHDQALQTQEFNVRRQQALVSSLDPNVIEAGKQTAALLQGKSAPVLQNLTQQRQLQRDQMLSQLRTQMGPGAETSTAGQQALAQFDQQTSNIMNQAQQQYLDKVSGMSMGGAQTLGESLSRVSQSLNQINEEGPEQQAAKLIAQFTAAEGGAASQIIQAAGGQYRGQQLQGQTIQQLGSGIMSLSGALAGRGSLRPDGTQPAPGTTPGSGDVTSLGSNAEFKMPDFGAGAGAGGPSYGLGTLGGSVAGPARRPVAAGGGAPANNLGMAMNYGGGGNDAYNLNPRTAPLAPFPGFNPNYKFAGAGGNIAGGQ